MPIQITGRHLSVGDSLRTHIEGSIKKVMGVFFDDIPKVSIVLNKEAHLFRVDIHVSLSPNFVAHCFFTDEDPYRAYNRACEKLESNMKKHKRKLRDSKRHHGADHDMDSVPLRILQAQEDDEDFEVSNEHSAVIIEDAEKKISILSVDEAIMRLELNEQEVLCLFKNALTGHINIAYRRFDKSIAWIDLAGANFV